MPYFEDERAVYGHIGYLLRAAVADEDLGARLRSADAVVQYDVRRPNARITANLRNEGDLRVDLGDTEMRPDVVLSMDGDTAHAYWQGEVNIAVALAKGQIKAHGPVAAILRLVPLSRDLFPRYREILEGGELPPLDPSAGVAAGGEEAPAAEDAGGEGEGEGQIAATEEAAPAAEQAASEEAASGEAAPAADAPAEEAAPAPEEAASEQAAPAEEAAPAAEAPAEEAAPAPEAPASEEAAPAPAEEAAPAAETPAEEDSAGDAAPPADASAPEEPVPAPVEPPEDLDAEAAAEAGVPVEAGASEDSETDEAQRAAAGAAEPAEAERREPGSEA